MGRGPLRIDIAEDVEGRDRPDPAGRAWLRRVLVLWVVLLGVVGVKTAIDPKRHSVYPLLVAGARHWWAGQPLYDYYPGLVGTYEIYRYSPTCALAFSPLAPFPDRYGGVLWNAANLGVLVAGLLVASRDLLPGRWTDRRLALLLGLVLVGTIRPAWNSQSNPIVAGFLLLGASAVARRRWWAASALLAIPVYLKLAPLAVALLLVALRPRALLGRFLLMMALGAALPFATRPPFEVISQYRAMLASLSHSSATRWPAFRDAWTLWELTGRPVHVPAYRLIQAIMGLATLAWCLGLKRRQPDARALVTATLAMGTAYLMVFGPSVEYPTYVVLAPMAAWGVLSAIERGEGRAWASLAYALTMVLGSEVAEHPLARLSPAAHAILPVGSLLFAGWVARYAGPRTPGPRPHRPGPHADAAGTPLDLRAPDGHDARARRDDAPPRL